MGDSGLSLKQKSAWARRQFEVEQDGLEALLHGEEGDLYRYLHNLMYQIYWRQADGRYLTKNQACRFIPAKHSSTCRKYLDLAVKEKLIEFKRSDIDKRKTYIKPSNRLISIVDAEVEESITELSDILDH